MEKPADLEGLQSQFSGIADRLVNETPWSAVGALLQAVKTHQKAMKERADAALSDVKEQVTTRREWFRAATNAIDRCESMLKGKIVAIHEAHEQDRRAAVAAGRPPPAPPAPLPGVSISETWEYMVIARDLLTPEFLCPDETAIKTAIKAAGKNRPVVPGVQFQKKKTVSVRTV